ESAETADSTALRPFAEPTGCNLSILGTSVKCTEFFAGTSRVPDRKQNLPQLYRFCFLMLGDSAKAQEVFQTTLREAALRAAQGELPREPFWLFRDARWRCLETVKEDLQPEALKLDEHDVAPHAASQFENVAVIAPATHTFELRANQPRQAGRSFHARSRSPRR